jgi:hypothetical protein
MSDQWPPDAPKLKNEFNKAVVNESEIAAQTPQHPIVTKAEIEALEKQRKQAAPEVHLTPTGTRTTQNQQSALEERIKKLQQRIGRKAGKAREDFQRGAEM